MKLLALCLLALVLPTSSLASGFSGRSTPEPALDAVASQIAGQDEEVRCYSSDPADEDPNAMPHSWGYVYLSMYFEFPTIYLDKRVCAGARALQTGAMLPLWQLALGALVLTHESYHQKLSLPFERRKSEAQTECRAIKRTPQTLVDLGASTSLAAEVLPWALAEHFKISSLHAPGKASPYDYSSCDVPGFEFWPR